MALINMVMFDLTLRTTTRNDAKLFSFRYSSEHTSYINYNFNLGYSLLFGDAINTFTLKYIFNKELIDVKNEFGLSYRFSIGELIDTKNNFTLRYQDEGYFPKEVDKYFRIPYQFGLIVHTPKIFSLRYSDEVLFLSDEYVFGIRYNLGLLREKELEFDLRYQDASFVADSSYVYQLLYSVGATEVRDSEFNFRYNHNYSLPADKEFTLPYQMRYANAEDPDNAIPVTIPNDDGTYDFELVIQNVTMTPGDYVAVIDSGSSYSGYFASFIIPDAVDADINLTLFNRNGVNIFASFSEEIDTIRFSVKDIDVDSSISISAYGTDAEDYSMMFAEWPSWYSYTHEDEISPPELVVLDSGNFKILPLQPNTCCLFKSNELCILPPYTEVDEVIGDIDTLKLEWELVNTALWDVSKIGKDCSAGLTEAALTPNRTVSLLTAEIVGPGTLEFEWMLKSTGNDSLWFEVSDVYSISITDQPDYITQSVEVPRGVYMLEWFYIKDETSDNSSPSDISAIDKITYKHR